MKNNGSVLGEMEGDRLIYSLIVMGLSLANKF